MSWPSVFRFPLQVKILSLTADNNNVQPPVDGIQSPRQEDHASYPLRGDNFDLKKRSLSLFFTQKTHGPKPVGIHSG